MCVCVCRLVSQPLGGETRSLSSPHRVESSFALCFDLSCLLCGFSPPPLLICKADCISLGLVFARFRSLRFTCNRGGRSKKDPGTAHEHATSYLHHNLPPISPLSNNSLHDVVIKSLGIFCWTECSVEAFLHGRKKATGLVCFQHVRVEFRLVVRRERIHGFLAVM